MAASFHNPKQRSRLGISILASVLCLLASACASTPSEVMDTVLVESPRGAVFLQKAEDRWFRTAHPVSLSPAALTAVFRGVQVQTLPADKATAVRVFSDEDTEFLSPLMSTALSKATKSQLIGFRVTHGTDAENETTGGFLYIQGRLLHLTFTHYRAQAGSPGRGGTQSRQSPNPTGLHQRQIDFVPETARRSNLNEQPDVINTPPLASLVIDYELLTTGSKPLSAPVQPQPLQPADTPVTPQHAQPTPPTSGAILSLDAQSEEVRSVKELVLKKAAELDALKEDVHTLQRRLTEIEADVQKTKNR